MTNNVSDWLRDVSSKTDLALRMDDDGDCVLGYGDNLSITISVPPHSPLVFFASVVGDLPAQGDRLALCEYLLRQNLFFDGTNGATFALDGELDRIVLNFAMPIASLEADSFENALGIFAETAEQWAAKIMTFSVAGGESNGAGSSTDVPEQFAIRV